MLHGKIKGPTFRNCRPDAYVKDTSCQTAEYTNENIFPTGVLEPLYGFVEPRPPLLSDLKIYKIKGRTESSIHSVVPKPGGYCSDEARHARKSMEMHLFKKGI